MVFSDKVEMDLEFAATTYAQRMILLEKEKKFEALEGLKELVSKLGIENEVEKWIKIFKRGSEL